MNAHPSADVPTVLLPEPTRAAIRERVGTEGLSAYVIDAVDRQLERDSLNDQLAAMEAANGPVDERLVQALIEDHFSA